MKSPVVLIAFVALSAAALAAPVPPRQLEVYNRAGVAFASAAFFKPAETPGLGLPFTLAPLLLQQVDSTDPTNRSAGPVPALDSVHAFGILVYSNQTLTLDKSHAALYYDTDTLEIGGKTHARFTYIWCYDLSKTRSGSALPLQGVRVTLDAGGNPCVWEVLADRSGLDLLFVSQHLEEGARAQYGAALDGRKFSIERGLAEAPEAIVARVIDDGPVPMGPFIYLEKGTHSAATLICRCMPAQARNLANTRLYDLIPAAALPGPPLRQALQASGLSPAFWPGEEARVARLEKLLRLPGSF